LTLMEDFMSNQNDGMSSENDRLTESEVLRGFCPSDVGYEGQDDCNGLDGDVDQCAQRWRKQII
jgi:hypothetical protein